MIRDGVAAIRRLRSKWAMERPVFGATIPVDARPKLRPAA